MRLRCGRVPPCLWCVRFVVVLWGVLYILSLILVYLAVIWVWCFLGARCVFVVVGRVRCRRGLVSLIGLVCVAASVVLRWYAWGGRYVLWALRFVGG